MHAVAQVLCQLFHTNHRDKIKSSFLQPRGSPRPKFHDIMMYERLLADVFADIPMQPCGLYTPTSHV